MKPMRSERLRKLETELEDLENWLKLGLVPKKDIAKHVEEINNIKLKIDEERERLHFLKESGEAEEYIAPKRGNQRAGYTDMPTIPDIDMGETAAGLTETGFDLETEVGDSDETYAGDGDEDEGRKESSDDESEEEEEEESYFSDRNRWRRGGIIDPDADEW
ncbi:MAG: hypothetical protein K0S07_1375 [Chlamydiales bacterium]|jgi:hypothetical protein|nr:hypothetical protein [Chlamydiales bacterium]